MHCQELGGQAYAHLVAAAAARMGPVPAVWRLFVDVEAARPPFDAMAKRFYEELACLNVVYSATGGAPRLDILPVAQSERWTGCI